MNRRGNPILLRDYIARKIDEHSRRTKIPREDIHESLLSEETRSMNIAHLPFKELPMLVNESSEFNQLSEYITVPPLLIMMEEGKPKVMVFDTPQRALDNQQKNNAEFMNDGTKKSLITIDNFIDFLCSASTKSSGLDSKSIADSFCTKNLRLSLSECPRNGRDYFINPRHSTNKLPSFIQLPLSLFAVLNEQETIVFISMQEDNEMLGLDEQIAELRKSLEKESNPAQLKELNDKITLLSLLNADAVEAEKYAILWKKMITIMATISDQTPTFTTEMTRQLQIHCLSSDMRAKLIEAITAKVRLYEPMLRSKLGRSNRGAPSTSQAGTEHGPSNAGTAGPSKPGPSRSRAGRRRGRK